MLSGWRGSGAIKMGKESLGMDGLGLSGDYDYLFKVLLIGDSGVGKSSLLKRFADCRYEESLTSTIGVDFKVRTVEVDDKKVKLQIWDAAGQERFRAISRSYYRGAHGVGIVFDLTEKKTFESVDESWLEEIMENDCAAVPHLLIGAKCDLEGRCVSEMEASSFAELHGMRYIEASAKTAENVTEAFVTITKQIYEERREEALMPMKMEAMEERLKEDEEVIGGPALSVSSGKESKESKQGKCC